MAKGIWTVGMGQNQGIIGLGVIGKSVAQRAKGFNMKVLAFDKYWDEEFASANGIIRSEVDEILRNLILLPCVPLMESPEPYRRKAVKHYEAYCIPDKRGKGRSSDEDAL